MVKENINLNYPIVLVHGISVHDRNKTFSCWGRIPETLENNGVQVFFGNTDSWGDYESNALILKETIKKILLKTNKEKVNIIAHSKGGLDARYLIWKHNFGGKVASLTTISTPHHGSEIADLINNGNLAHTKTANSALTLYGRLSNDIRPNIYSVNYQLTTKYMKQFNAEVINDDNVYYQSFYTTTKNAFQDRLFIRTYNYLKRNIGANDGLVSAFSSQWYNTTKIEGSISHREIQDIKRRKISSIDIPDIYINIVKDLRERGF